MKAWGVCQWWQDRIQFATECEHKIYYTLFIIKFDGSHWHDDPGYDRRRDEFVKSQGYKVLRIDGRRKSPEKEELFNAIQLLLDTDRKFHRIETKEFTKERNNKV